MIADTTRRPRHHLKSKIVEFVTHGDFGLASGKKTDGAYERFGSRNGCPRRGSLRGWSVPTEEATAASAQDGAACDADPNSGTRAGSRDAYSRTRSLAEPGPEPTGSTRMLRLVGSVPPEMWNRLGTKILPKLRSGSELKIGLEFAVTVSADSAERPCDRAFDKILQELGLAEA